MPSVWCPGCGIGTVVHTFVQAIKEMHIDSEALQIVSGIGCSGKIAEYLNFKSHRARDGNAVEYAARVADDDPESKVVVFTNNADLLISGAKDLFESGKKEANILVIHINNFIYCMTENGVMVNTPFIRKSFDNELELPFNIPHLAKLYNATYVARWTTLRAGWLRYSFMDGLSRNGLSLVEIPSPCLLFFPKTDKIGDATARMRFYNDRTIIKQYEPTENLDLRSQEDIVLGKFVDERASSKDV
jgi:2-oxoglutarate ferredoxin oxidoreductase subunit beta